VTKRDTKLINELLMEAREGQVRIIGLLHGIEKNLKAILKALPS
jgi:hypothetical protein